MAAVDLPADAGDFPALVSLLQNQPVIDRPGIGSAIAVRPERAPALIAIVLYKFVKGLLLLLAAYAVYSFAGREHALPPLLGQAGDYLSNIQPHTVHLIALGGVFYGFFSFVEGAGLFLRSAWAGWMAIIESGLFVPVEIFDLSRQFTAGMTVILAANVAIFWYLLANRRRLFASSNPGDASALSAAAN